MISALWVIVIILVLINWDRLLLLFYFLGIGIYVVIRLLITLVERVNEAIAKLGENIKIGKFIRFEI